MADNPMQLLREFWKQLTALFIGQEVNRDLPMGALYNIVDNAIYFSEEGGWLLDIYTDGDELYAICTRNGKLYRHPISIDENDEVTLGEGVAVKTEFTPIAERSSFRVFRDANGKARWNAVCATATLNRVGEIDSMELFDSFIGYAEDSGEYPYVTLYHAGEALRMGTADLLFRDRAVYFASGTFEENELAEAMERELESDPDYWGISIGYIPTLAAEMVEVAPDIRVPVYRQGKHVEISLLPEAHAASLLTAVKLRGINMSRSQQLKEALLKAFNGDEAKADEWVSKVDETNRSIEANRMIVRDADGAEPPVPTADPVPEQEQESGDQGDQQTTPTVTTTPVYEVTEDVIGAIVTAMENAPFIQTLKGMIETVSNDLKVVQSGFTDMETARKRDDQRIAALERDDEQKRQQYVADLPRKNLAGVVTFRPRNGDKPSADDNTDDGDKPLTIEERANAVLEKIEADNAKRNYN